MIAICPDCDGQKLMHGYDADCPSCGGTGTAPMTNAQTEARAIADLIEEYVDAMIYYELDLVPPAAISTAKERQHRADIAACKEAVANALAAKDAELDDAKNHVAELEMERDRLISELNTLSTQLAEANKALEEIGNGCDGRIDKDALPCRIARRALTGGNNGQ